MINEIPFFSAMSYSMAGAVGVSFADGNWGRAICFTILSFIFSYIEYRLWLKKRKNNGL